MAVSRQSILIISSERDFPHVQPVADELERQGFKSIIYKADAVTKGILPLEIQLGPESFDVTYNGQSIHPDTIAAAWYRKPNWNTPILDKGKQLSIDTDIRKSQEMVWAAVPKNVWLNSPELIKQNEEKLSQLLLAKELGFRIPLTVVSNRWGSIRKLLPNDKTILKMPYGSLYVDNQPRALYTTIFANNQGALPSSTNPFPGIWQPYLSKKREWRVTVVGSDVFAAAIYTTPETNDDWRQYTDGVVYRRETFPDELGRRCCRMLQRMGLQYGAFDFIESQDGSITFLEVNPNGQYIWIEEELKLPISKSIAHKLIAIAIKSGKSRTRSL